MYILITCCCQVLWTSGLLYASSRTIQSHAYVLNNVHGLFIVLIGFFQGEDVTKKEWKGLLIQIIGCILMMVDPSAQRIGEIGSSPVVPDLINLCSAFFGAVYFLINAKNVSSLPVMSLIFFMNIHFFIINSCLAIIT